MKKVLSFVIVVAAVAMVSCGGNTGKATVATPETTPTEQATTAPDTTQMQQADTTTTTTPAATPAE